MIGYEDAAVLREKNIKFSNSDFRSVEVYILGLVYHLRASYEFQELKSTPHRTLESVTSSGIRTGEISKHLEPTATLVWYFSCYFSSQIKKAIFYVPGYKRILKFRHKELFISEVNAP